MHAKLSRVSLLMTQTLFVMDKKQMVSLSLSSLSNLENIQHVAEVAEEVGVEVGDGLHSTNLLQRQ